MAFSSFTIPTLPVTTVAPAAAVCSFPVSGEYILIVDGITRTSGAMSFATGTPINTLIATINSRIGVYATVSIVPIATLELVNSVPTYVIRHTVVVAPTNPNYVITQSGNDSIFRAFDLLP